MATVTDLTNTTWHIPAGWIAEAGYGCFQMNFDLTINTSDGSIIEIKDCYDPNIGYQGGILLPNDNCLSYNLSDGSASYLSNKSGCVFYFKGGTDATNEKLIAWLEANGGLASGGEEDELYLIDESTLTEIADAIRAKKGITGYLDPANFASEILSIGQAPTMTIISFTIDGTAYQAEEGMTWAEWCANSDYNTDGYYVSANRIMSPGASLRIISNVTPDAIIQANTEYVLDHGGGSN